MKITFEGVPGEDIKEINAYGYHFTKGKATDVPEDDKLAAMKLSNHPHFSGGTVKREHLTLPQSILAVDKTYIVSDGIATVTQAEIDAINRDPRMLPGSRVGAEEVLKAKEENDDDFRTRSSSAPQVDTALARSGRGERGPRDSGRKA